MAVAGAALRRMPTAAPTAAMHVKAMRRNHTVVASVPPPIELMNCWSVAVGTRVAPGERVVLADLDGPGVLRHLWLTFTPAPPEETRAIILEVFYGDAAMPSVSRHRAASRITAPAARSARA